MSDPSPPVERRRNQQLRELWPQACESLRPFFETSTLWEGQTHEHLAYQALREQFPQLGAQDILIVVMTAKRMYVRSTHQPNP